MCQNRKPLSSITLDDAFHVYKQCSMKAKTVMNKRLAEDRDGHVVLQRHDGHTEEWANVVIFTDGFAYIYGGDSPERFEKNIRMNFLLWTLGYTIHFQSLEGHSEEQMSAFLEALLTPVGQ
jgi:hypothetical protein